MLFHGDEKKRMKQEILSDYYGETVTTKCCVNFNLDASFNNFLINLCNNILVHRRGGGGFLNGLSTNLATNNE